MKGSINDLVPGICVKLEIMFVFVYQVNNLLCVPVQKRKIVGPDWKGRKRSPFSQERKKNWEDSMPEDCIAGLFIASPSLTYRHVLNEQTLKPCLALEDEVAMLTSFRV